MGQVYYYLKTDDSNEETESDEQNNLAVSAAVSIAESYVQADDYEALKDFNTQYEGETSFQSPYRQFVEAEVASEYTCHQQHSLARSNLQQRW